MPTTEVLGHATVLLRLVEVTVLVKVRGVDYVVVLVRGSTTT